MKVTSAQHAHTAATLEGLVTDGRPQVAFAGRSNVGKSSLLNRLLGRKKLARTSSTPGRTRALIYFLVNDGFYFVDLPGYGYAKVSKSLRREWDALLDDYFRQAGPELKVVQLVDAKVGATPLDVAAYDYLTGVGRRPTVVATRADRVTRGRRKAAAAAVSEALGDGGEHPRTIAVSARTGEGVRELWREIADHLESARISARG